jgi:hypothetical protein
MLSLRPPVKTEAELKAIAASGMAGTTKARAELKRRTVAGLAQAVKPS